MTQQKQKTVAILGGGVGGLVTANELAKKIGSGHRIILIDREAQHVFQSSFLWLMTGDRKESQISRDLAKLERKGIEVVIGEITSIDPDAKAVVVGDRTIVADYIVVSLGAQLAPSNVPGLVGAGHNLYSLDGAGAIRDGRGKLTSGKIVVLISGMPFKCPAAPYEAAMLLEADLRKRGVRDRVSVTVYSPEPGPMGVAGPDVSAGVREIVESKGIDYHPRHQISSVDPDQKILKFDDGSEEPFDFLVYVPPHVGPSVLQESGLTNETGWIPVDRNSMATEFDGVFAIGDNTIIPLEVGLPLPKAGTFASGQARVVAKTIIAELTGRGDAGRYDGFGECVVEVGDGKAGLGRGNFYGLPLPTVNLRKPSRLWHLGKVWFEWRWMRRWF